MNKKIILSAAFATAALPALAGGYLTNTNQSAAFLRMPAQEAVISVQGAYYNPAGVGFLSNGWHEALNIQSAYQTRTATSHFDFFQYGAANNGATTKKYKGKASAPVIPSFDLAYVHNRWFGSFHFGLTGGGGKAEFKDGLGSFESLVSMLPVVAGALSGKDASSLPYSFDSYMRGRQYYFGGQLGIGYKIKPGLSVSLGGRLTYATTNYYGHVQNIQLAGVPVATLLSNAGITLSNTNLSNVLANGINLNCDQTGWGFAPIVGVHWQNGRWNVAAKYEFKTRMRLTNRSNLTEGEALSNLAEFTDGKKVTGDIPALLAAGAQYAILPNLRAAAGFHYYFDKDARQYNDKQKRLDGNTWEITAGLEYDLNDRWTVSAGGQSTNYGLGKNSRYISDMSFVTSSYSVGLGAKFKVNKSINMEVAYFKTFYKKYRKQTGDYNDLGSSFSPILQQYAQNAISTATAALIAQGMDAQTAQAAATAAVNAKFAPVQSAISSAVQNGFDSFHRTNDVFGIGIEFHF